jgi:hypothetical protein
MISLGVDHSINDCEDLTSCVRRVDVAAKSKIGIQYSLDSVKLSLTLLY